MTLLMGEECKVLTVPPTKERLQPLLNTPFLIGLEKYFEEYGQNLFLSLI